MAKYLGVAGFAAGVVTSSAHVSTGRVEFQRSLTEYLTGLDLQGRGRHLVASDVPTVSKTFAGSLQEGTSQSSMMPLKAYTVYDELNSVQVTKVVETLPFKGATPLNTTTYLTKSEGSFLTINDRCQPLPSQDVFAPQ